MEHIREPQIPDRNRNTVRVQYRDEWEIVEPTGRLDNSLFEAYIRENHIDWLPKRCVHPEDVIRIPRESADKTEKEKGIFFIPKPILESCSDQRLRYLANRVWRRLPSHDRRVLAELLTEITDQDEAGPLDSIYNYHSGLKSDYFSNKELVEVAENFPFRISLAGLEEIESDPVVTYMIVHEFARTVLRQPQVLGVAYAGYSDKSKRIYFDDDLIMRQGWSYDHAVLQTWLWGFAEEFRAYLKISPQLRRPRWFNEPTSPVSESEDGLSEVS